MAINKECEKRLRMVSDMIKELKLINIKLDSKNITQEERATLERKVKIMKIEINITKEAISTLNDLEQRVVIERIFNKRRWKDIDIKIDCSERQIFRNYENALDALAIVLM